ncbi:MAG: hypothetical protein GOMPHAMPRED_005285 [Gomphillus americanus]|uniref:AB hydrolase-1 domain-containing protein n=1 Tax=Gomphillus americanus TaxID=1940652 RepID=A0A8H3FPW9_9LECA|nr:MAG: hypothetical protein GOMPHAMPRED_005285 [Gomphillus americanus]
MGPMRYEHFHVSDGCKIAFQTSETLDTPMRNTIVLLVHGFSGSSAYFKKNFASLSAIAWTVAVDLRGHGESGRPDGGYHVARLAADLKELITYLRKCLPNQRLSVVPVGCSIGAAVLWTYVELFSDEDFIAMVFVDQAPLQDRSLFGDWNQSLAHRGCFDEASLLAAQKYWIEEPEMAFKDLVKDCLGYRYQPLPSDTVTPEQARADEEFFVGESRKCDTLWLARLLGDHTRYDHREACEMICVPVLVMMGTRSGCFSLQGMMETVQRVNKGRYDRGIQSEETAAQALEFDSGHWLFWEEPKRFHNQIAKLLMHVMTLAR